MVTIGINYQVLEGKEEVFEGACRKVLDVMHEADYLPRVMAGAQAIRRPSSATR